jgi:2-polyprenyl-3-methyl-5-hydroxy-6-metoxy-1,4-benzoquinol methylase
VRLARRLEPEWLDTLPSDDPDAIGSRRDLHRINTLMLQTGIMRRALTEGCGPRPPRTLLEIGAGDGTFMLRVARRLAPHWPDVRIVLLDRQPIVTAQTRDAFRAIGWTADIVTADVFDYLEHLPATFDVVAANLFLHHFSAVGLTRLFAMAAPATRVFVACEPRRAGRALGASRMLWAIGCNRVTRHDAPASVRAGFAGDELSGMWPARAAWDVQEYAAGPFSHGFVARRVAEGPPA